MACVVACPGVVPGTCGIFDAGAGCAPLRCGASCAPGLACRDGACQVPQVCDKSWCYEYPLPQGGHLFAAYGETRPDGGGYFAWGGERGALFEWDGVDTTWVPLPAQTGAVIGFYGALDGGLRLYTSSGARFVRHGLADWRRQGVLGPSTTSLECTAASRHGELLGCAVVRENGVVPDGGPRAVVAVGAPVGSGQLLALSPAGVRVTAVEELTTGERMAFVLHADGGTVLYVEGPTPPFVPIAATVSPDGGSLTATIGRGTVTSLDALADVDGIRGLATVAYDGVPEVGVEGRRLAFRSTWATWTATVVPTQQYSARSRGDVQWVAGRSTLELHRLSGLSFPLVADHERAWLDVAWAGEWVLAVGAFGSTAVLPTSGSPGVPSSGTIGQLTSGRVALRPTDLCGPGPDGQPVIGVSGGNRPNTLDFARRPEDYVALEPTQLSGGTMLKRSSTGGWAPTGWFRADAAGDFDAGLWSPATDQCTFAEDGGFLFTTGRSLYTRTSPTSASVLRLPSRFAAFKVLGLESTGQRVVITPLSQPPLVVEQGTPSYASAALLRQPMTFLLVRSGTATHCSAFGIGGDTFCVNNRLFAYDAGMAQLPAPPYFFDGGVWFEADGTIFGFDGGTWTSTGGAIDATFSYAGASRAGPAPVAWVTQASAADGGGVIVDFLRRTAITSPAACGGPPCLPGFSSAARLWTPGPRPYRLWVDTDGQPWFLAADAGTASPLPASNPRDLDFTLGKLLVDGGVEELAVPDFVWVEHLALETLTVTGTSDRLFIQWPRGVISRLRP